jgi:hypothetical protein
MLHLTHDCQVSRVYCSAGTRRNCGMSWEVRGVYGLFCAQDFAENVLTPQICFLGLK